MLEALVVHDQHHQVYAFDADLQSPASAANGHERRRAPAVGGAARRDAASVLAAKNEPAFDQVGNHQDALRIAQHFFGNSFVRSSHDGVQNIDGRYCRRSTVSDGRCLPRPKFQTGPSNPSTTLTLFFS